MLNDKLKNSLVEYDDWRLLGRGTFSAVYRVREQRTGRLLACKVVASRELAEREKEFLQKASHPLFPQFERFEHLQDCWCIFMEYIPGITLKELVGHRGSVTGRQAVRLGCSLAEGLLFLHEQAIPIIYRDLKPENVMIQQDGRVRLIDLGCACFVEEKRRTQAGTRGYAAPEQLEGDGMAGVESDVYALGKLLQFVVGADSESGPPGSGKLQKIPNTFLDLLADMTRPESKQRVPDMRIFLQQMEQFSDGKKTQGIRRVCAVFRKWGKRRTRKKGYVKFYYQKNINRGI